jgi:hypothetical protein
MKISKTPVLDVATKAARQGTATARLTISPGEAKRIREAEAAGGPQAGLLVVLQLLRDRQEKPESLRA